MQEPEDDPIVALPSDESAVVVAGPGCGKSWRIARRIERIAREGQISASQIVVVSLTHSTVNDLQRSIEHAIVSTVHSFALTHLNRIGDAPRRRVVDPWEQANLVCVDLAGTYGEVRITPGDVGKFVTRLGTGFRENQEEPANLSPIERAIRERWLSLREYMEFRLMDELSYDLLRLLESGTALDEPPRIVMADEYQDLTPCELALLKKIHDEYGTAIFACGDDRQSIFGFREADPNALNNFCRVYGLTEPFYMSESRRCPEVICLLAEEVASRMPPIAGLTERPPLHAHASVQPGEVSIATYPSAIREAKEAHADIVRRRELGALSSDFMVIVPRGIEIYIQMLNQASSDANDGVVYFDTRTKAGLADSPEFRALYALCRIARQRNDHLAWRTLIYLARGYRPTFVRSILNAAATTFTAALSGMAALNEQAGRIWSATTEAIGRMREAESWNQLLQAADGWLDSMDRPVDRDWEQLTNAEEWQEIAASELPTGEEAERRFEILAGSLLQVTQRRRGDSAPEENEIPVYTIHQSKGLQAKHVYLVGASATAFLDSGDSPADGVRRLYVGLTRSMESLAISIGWRIQHRHFPLHKRLGVDAVELTPHVAESAHALGIHVTIVR